MEFCRASPEGSKAQIVRLLDAFVASRLTRCFAGRNGDE